MFLDTEPYSGNSDAHRVRSTNMTPPAMTWHMAFWIPQFVDDSTEEIDSFEKSINRSMVQESLDKIISKITEKLREKIGEDSVILKPSVKDIAVLFSKCINNKDLSDVNDKILFDNYGDIKPIVKRIKESDHRVIMIEFPWLDYWMTIRCGLQTEYFTVIVIAEAKRNCRDELEKIGAVNFFGKAITNLVKKYSDVNPKEIHLEFLFENFWMEFNRFIRSLEDVNDLMSTELLKQVYADSRGLITADYPPRGSEIELFPENGDNNYDVMRWAYSSVKRYRREITSEGRYECTASFMLDKRAVFMTALGPQNPNRDPNSRNPLTFVICLRNNLPPMVAPVNKWQLGRLVDRIHFLGRSRLAALRNVKILRLVSAQLSRIDQMISDARKDVEHYGSKEGIDLINVDNVEKLRKRLNFISNHFLDLTEKDSKSGILYRVERSRYYVSQFRNNIEQLRISRIEGYQKYDDFIEKRLGGTFDSIDRIGVRYERALRAMAEIDQNYLAAQSRNLAIRSHRANASIEEIQRWGELFLIGILVPYYFLGLFEHIIKYEMKLFVCSIFVVLGTTIFSLLRFEPIDKSRAIKTKYFGEISSHHLILISGIAMYVLIFALIIGLRSGVEQPEKEKHSENFYFRLLFPHEPT